MDFAEAFFAVKGQPHQPRHIERRDACGQQRREPQDLRAGEQARIECIPQNLVFREEARERHDAADGQPACHHRLERHRHILLQAAHSRHLLLVVHAVNHRAGAEEQQRLEEGVREDVKDCRDECSDARA